MHGDGARFGSGAEAKAFLLAGNATLTLVSEATGARYTYRVRLSRRATGPATVHYVDLLAGPDNEGDYVPAGVLLAGARFAPKRGGEAATSARAFGWAFGYLVRGELPPRCAVWHSGRCGKCGRSLTVPESIATGLGPTCARAA